MSDQKGKGDHHPDGSKSPFFFFAFLIAIIGILIAVDIIHLKNNPRIIINPTYIALALVGVAFHLINQYRKHRDQEGFNWQKYKYDYVHRVVQAVIYVFVVNNILENRDSPENDLFGQIALISLFVGMYIQKVEEAFESLGDRFGGAIRGILGTPFAKLDPAEKRVKLKHLQNRFDELNEQYDTIKKQMAQDKREALEQEFKTAMGLIQKGKIDEAESALLAINYQVTDPALSGPAVPPTTP